MMPGSGRPPGKLDPRKPELLVSSCAPTCADSCRTPHMSHHHSHPEDAGGPTFQHWLCGTSASPFQAFYSLTNRGVLHVCLRCALCFLETGGSRVPKVPLAVWLRVTPRSFKTKAGCGHRPLQWPLGQARAKTVVAGRNAPASAGVRVDQAKS